MKKIIDIIVKPLRREVRDFVFDSFRSYIFGKDKPEGKKEVKVFFEKYQQKSFAVKSDKLLLTEKLIGSKVKYPTQFNFDEDLSSNVCNFRSKIILVKSKKKKQDDGECENYETALQTLIVCTE